MRRRLLFDETGRHSSKSGERDRFYRQKGRRAHRFSLESLESRCLLSNITPYVLPADSGGVKPNPTEITTAGGKLWFSEITSNAIGMLNPANPGASQALPLGPTVFPGAITSGPDGNVWFTEHNISTGQYTIGMINTTGTPQVSNPLTLPGGETPQSLAAGKTLIWYVDSSTNALGSFNPSTKVVNSEVGLGNDQSGKSMIGLSPTSEIVVDNTDGMIWFTEYNGTTGAIGSYNPGTKAWAQYLLGTGQEPYAITTGPGGNIWFSEAVPDQSVLGFGSSALGMINVSTPGTPTYFPLATTSSGAVLPYRIVEGPDGNIWYTGNNDSTHWCAESHDR